MTNFDEKLRFEIDISTFHTRRQRPEGDSEKFRVFFRSVLSLGPLRREFTARGVLYHGSLRPAGAQRPPGQPPPRSVGKQFLNCLALTSIST